MATPDRPKFRGLNSFPSKHVEEIVIKSRLYQEKKAVFLPIFKPAFRKINLTIDNPKAML
jgi:hypothetical protein